MRQPSISAGRRTDRHGTRCLERLPWRNGNVRNRPRDRLRPALPVVRKRFVDATPFKWGRSGQHTVKVPSASAVFIDCRISNQPF